MDLFPETQQAFDELIASEAACQQYLAAIRWPDGFVCPACGHTVAWQLGTGLYQCRQCRRRVSVTSGTLFHDTRMPLSLWFRAIWYVTSQKSGASALGVQRVLGLGSYHTAWTWLHRLRRAMVRPDRDRLSGTVEVDETFWGATRPGKHGRGAAGKTLILVAVEYTGKHIGRIRLQRIPDAQGTTLQTAVQAAVVPGSVIETDGLYGYRGMSAAGYTHRVVRAETPQEEADLLPHVHLVVSLLKRWLLGTLQGGIHVTHLDYYLDEFTFRFNRRTSHSRGKLFRRVLEYAVQVDPIREQDLRASARKG